MQRSPLEFRCRTPVLITPYLWWIFLLNLSTLVIRFTVPDSRANDDPFPKRSILVRFRAVFAIFNVVIVVSFLVIYLMPLFMLGWDYTSNFWSENWGLPVLFGAILCGLNGYFIFNWKLFTLLEREDWDSLIEHLEHRIFEKHIILAQQCRILVNAYLVRSKLDSIQRLEDTIREKRSSLVKRLAMPLGIQHLLSNESSSMLSYFGQFKDERGRDSGWIRWSYAFASLLAENPDTAGVYLSKVVETEREPVLLVLSLYLLDGIGPDSLSDRKNQLKAKYTREKLEQEIERQRAHVQVVILARLIENAVDWLYSEKVA